MRETRFQSLGGEDPLEKSESEVAQSCRALCDPVDCSPPRSSVRGIFQARVDLFSANGQNARGPPAPAALREKDMGEG